MASWRDRPASELRGWLEYICSRHRPGSQTGAVNELVVMDVAEPDLTTSLNGPSAGAQDTLDTAQIDALLPYFPGGHGNCQFSRVYVGTVDFSQQVLVTPGVARPYHDEVQVPAVVESMLDRSTRVARAFAAHVATSSEPRATWDWYVTQEGFLDYFVDSNASPSGSFAGAMTSLPDGVVTAQAT